MEEIIILEYQAKTIENTLRLVSNVLKSHSRESSLDRDIMQSLSFIKNVLNKNPQEYVQR
jgi:hypothetical protein